MAKDNKDEVEVPVESPEPKGWSAIAPLGTPHPEIDPWSPIPPLGTPHNPPPDPEFTRPPVE